MAAHQLPDVTVVMPVFVDGTRRFFVAARGHQADIGGTTPGSMPPFSKTIAEEGALFDGIRMVRDGHFDEAAIRKILGGGAWPARNPDQNIADLEAQIAACASASCARRSNSALRAGSRSTSAITRYR